jgi:ABC-type bacteriocin/lantibiotic exporter with double-glycine peptidase domain
MAETQEIQQTFPPTADLEEHPSPRRDRTKISLPRVLALLRPYRWRLVVAAVLLVLTNGLGLLFPLVIRTLLNTILGQHNERLLNIVVLVLLAVFVLQAVLGALQGYLVTSLGERLSFDLRTALFRTLFSHMADAIQHFIIARDLLKGYVKIGAWE